jgi:pimeloyl-ACP methyl ester carboxylesterase
MFCMQYYAGLFAKAAMRRIERTIRTPHAEIRATETDGQGFPVVLLHGSGAERHVFEPQLQGPLGERHRLIALDLPGHGESTDAVDPPSGYTLPGYAQTVGEALKALGVSRAVIFGWSLGGHIGIELMSERPELVAGLMLTGAPPVARGPLGMLRGFHASWDMLLASKETFSERDVERYARLCYGEAATPALKAAIRRSDGRARVFLSRSMMRGDGADQKRAVETAGVPIAIVCGQHDPLVRTSYLAGLSYGTLWDGHVHMLAGAGHAAFRDDPERFNALLLRFAADCEAYTVPLEMPAARRA